MGIQAPLALTMGDPAGIGGELTLAAWENRDGLPVFLTLDDPERLARLADALSRPVPIRAISSPGEAARVWPDALPVLPCPLAAPVVPGHPDPANAPAVIDAIRRAVALTKAGETIGLVTNPISKAVLMAAGFRHPGHTEYLAELAGNGARPIMMLACAELRVVPVTVHLALRDAAAALDRAMIVEAGVITATALRDLFGIAAPRLAVAGLNPHAGEDGRMGREEIDIVAPAVHELQRRGIDARGPLPADTMFHPAARQQYDAALCMYHDQALIPIKTIDFAGGVNLTLGLPFIRTSPDHGTAFDIAGRGRADPTSLFAALRLAGALAQRRRA